jgi:hypothetical protein
MFICGALRALGSYDVWIYASARRGLTAHPHLKHFLRATVYSQPELNLLAANSGIHVSGCAIYSTAFEAAIATPPYGQRVPERRTGRLKADVVEPIEVFKGAIPVLSCLFRSHLCSLTNLLAHRAWYGMRFSPASFRSRR